MAIKKTPIKDEYHYLLQKINKMEKQIKNLHNIQNPTLPLYDNTNFPDDAANGQIVLDPITKQLWAYDDDNGWWPVGGGITEIDSPDLSINVTNPMGPVVDIVLNKFHYWSYADNLTIPAGSPGQLDFSWTVNNSQSGNPLPLNYTTFGASSTVPKFVRDGLVWFRVQVSRMPGDAALGAGALISFSFQTPAPIAIFPDVLSLWDETHFNAAGGEVTLRDSGFKYCFGLDGIKLVLGNNDSIDHDVFARIDMVQIVGGL